MSETTCTTQTEILEAATLGLPWSCTLVYIGTTAKGNSSRKFWAINGVGTGLVMVRWGRIGNKAQGKPAASLGDALSRLASKQAKGYTGASVALA